MPKMFNNEAHEKLDFVIPCLKQRQNPHTAILELDSQFKDCHPTEQEVIPINNLFSRTKLATENKVNQVKPFKNPNAVNVETVEDTPAPPSSPNLKPTDPLVETINPTKPQQAVPAPCQEEPVIFTQTDQTGNKEPTAKKPMETEETLNLFQTALCKSWESMDVSFTPDEVYVSALKKFQDRNAPALPIPALVNHQKPEDNPKKKTSISKSDTGLLAKDILANTKIKVSLEDFCRKSPAFCSKMHVAISDTQKKRTQELMLTVYGAPRVKGTLEGVPTKFILDRGTYANIVLAHFLGTIGIEDITTCNQKYILADGSIAPCLGVVDTLQLEIEGVAIHISAAVFDHH
ncbi:hypothetical protein DSO57_1029803 [Entomophthora muscae]|uniref:Uncharacterized protein n=1 Tax=Entomophthora muscae TaxID=34485 RepID=A0ACC2TZT6_9FUNG|nr:hypothetical protein DSO57_1029803 [Entomophthora muscae]